MILHYDLNKGFLKLKIINVNDLNTICKEATYNCNSV